MEKEKSEAYLGTVFGYKVFVTVAEKLKEQDENSEYKMIMNGWMFHKQDHICKTRTDLRRKLEHNKKAKKLCQIFNRDFN